MIAPALDAGRSPLGPSPLGPFAGSAPIAPRPARRREIAPNATLVDRIDLTPSVARFVVRPDGGVPPFSPGKYFALGLEVEGLSCNVPIRRRHPPERPRRSSS
ncbi:MAG: hypothetical protein ABSD62_04145 [Candidatus Limnocylindrales bacterium]|jgi:hypothetical protein